MPSLPVYPDLPCHSLVTHPRLFDVALLAAVDKGAWMLRHVVAGVQLRCGSQFPSCTVVWQCGRPARFPTGLTIYEEGFPPHAGPLCCAYFGGYFLVQMIDVPILPILPRLTGRYRVWDIQWFA